MSTQAHHEQASLFSDDTSTRRHPRHVLSYGLGLDSTAVLLRWLTDPSSRDFDLSDLVVITAMTGDEFSATGADVERYVLPELRRHRVRFVQVGRHQLLTTAAGEGITTFSDTTEPDRLFVEGAYALSTEMLTAGTLPQRGGARKCSARAKGAVLDPVIARLTGGQPYQHYVGFEVDEMGRAERDAAYNTAARTGRYPLIQWGWTRADCDTFVYNLTGRRWLKSACSYCPFALSSARGVQSTLQRYAADPAAGALALFIEHVAVCINDKQTLRPTGRLYDDVAAAGLTGVLDLFHRRLDDTEHAIYEVRRVAKVRRTGTRPVIARSVRLLDRGSRAGMAAVLLGMPGQLHTGNDGIARSIALRRGETPPWAERFYVACPAVVADKARPHFERWFAEVASDVALF